LVVLPPAAALRAFEAAARHGSFTAAAHELNITPSAVSHQLRHLEDLWRMALFARGRHLSLTTAGQRLAPIVRQFLNSLEDTLADLRSPDLVEPLKVSLTQSFAVKWLLPRLPAFSAATPTVNIWISTTDELARFDVQDIDVAIRIGTGPYDPLHAELLLRQYIFPVASPALIQRFGDIDEPADILRLPLVLRSGKSSVPRWELWFEKVGLERRPPSRPTFSGFCHDDRGSPCRSRRRPGEERPHHRRTGIGPPCEASGYSCPISDRISLCLSGRSRAAGRDLVFQGMDIRASSGRSAALRQARRNTGRRLPRGFGYRVGAKACILTSFTVERIDCEQTLIVLVKRQRLAPGSVRGYSR